MCGTNTLRQMSELPTQDLIYALPECMCILGNLTGEDRRWLIPPTLFYYYTILSKI